jgi:hypothetical protein
MNANKVNSGRFEINDLIDDAVKNAVARRSQVIDSEDALLVLAETEAQSILGGAVAIPESAIFKSKPWVTAGMIAPVEPICPPVITGKIAVLQPTPKPTPKPTPIIVDCPMTTGLIAVNPKDLALTSAIM